MFCYIYFSTIISSATENYLLLCSIVYGVQVCCAYRINLIVVVPIKFCPLKWAIIVIGYVYNKVDVDIT